MNITLCGMGAGGAGLLTREAEMAIAGAQCVIGAERLLKMVETGAVKQVCTLPDEMADLIKRSSFDRVCVLVTGDPGLFSAAKKLTQRLAQADIRVLPGISSIQVFAAALLQPWEDWHIVSAHGRDCSAAAEVTAHNKVCFLTDARHSPDVLCQALCDAGYMDARAVIGENLSYPHQRIIEGTAAQVAQMRFDPLSLLLISHEKPPMPAVQGFPDEMFVRGDVPMTKREVRAASLSHLALREKDVCWDVGAGTGSVAVEMALRARFGQVYAVECEAAGCALTRENAARFHAHNLTVVQGMAPDALSSLPAPDAVFIGGSKGRLEDILNEARSKNPSVRVVVNAITLETAALAMRLFSQGGFRDVQIVQITVARAKAVGPSHMLMGQNPVFILCAKGAQEDG